MRLNEMVTSGSNRPAVVCDENGFTINDGDRTAANVRWLDVYKVIAFKRDDFTIDTLCIQVMSDPGHFTLLTEDMAGFALFLEQMASVLPGIPADWRQKVIVTAFAENDTLLFQKPSV